jgi:amino acid transporter
VRPGYAIGVICWVTSVFSWATVAHGLGEALAGAFGWGPGAARGLAVATTVALGGLNYLGVKLGAATVLGLTVLKLVPLAVVIAAGCLLFSAERFVPFAPNGWSGFGATTLFVLFAYQGFEVAPVPAGETRDAARVVPRAVLAAVALTTVLYLVINTVVIGALPDLAGAPDALVRVATRAFGDGGAAILRIGAIVSTLGFSAGVALVCPHYLTALCDDGHLPRWLGHRHARFGGPTRATILCTATTAALAAGLDFSHLLDFTNEAVCVQYLSTAASVLVLAARDPLGERMSPLRRVAIPVGAAAVTAWLFSQAGWQGMVGLLVCVAAGFLVREVFVRPRPRLS